MRSNLQGSRVQPLSAHLRGYLISACGLTDFAGKGWDLNLVRDAQAHFERSRAIDPSDVVAEAFLSQVNPCIQHAFMNTGVSLTGLLWRLAARRDIPEFLHDSDLRIRPHLVSRTAINIFSNAIDGSATSRGRLRAKLKL